MSQVQIGDRIMSMREDGHLEFSKVLAFLDRSSTQMGLYYTLTTESGKQLTLTAKHLAYVIDDVTYTTLYTSRDFNKTSTIDSTNFQSAHTSWKPVAHRVVLAEEVKVGQYLLMAHTNTDYFMPKSQSSQNDYSAERSDTAYKTTAMSQVSPSAETGSVGVTKVEKVVSVTAQKITGVYAPLTSSGTIVVDGVVTSCYAFYKNEQIAHGVFAPMRAYHRVKDFLTDWLHEYSQYSSTLKWVEHFMWSDTWAEHFMLSDTSDSFGNESEANSSARVQQDGPHWWARALYNVAVNVLGMDLTIKM